MLARGAGGWRPSGWQIGRLRPARSSFKLRPTSSICCTKGDGGGIAITSGRHDLMMNAVISRRPWRRYGQRSVGGIYVVQAKRDDQIEYWAAATIKEKAVAAVEKELGPGWIVALTDRRLTGQRLSKLRMCPNTVQKL